jgi:hypothetical protein
MFGRPCCAWTAHRRCLRARRLEHQCALRKKPLIHSLINCQGSLVAPLFRRSS